MKTQAVVLALVVVIMLASFGGTYLLFSHQAQENAKIASGLRQDISVLGGTLRKLDSQIKGLETQGQGYDEQIKGLAEKVSQAEIERRDINSRVGSLIHSVEGLMSMEKAEKPAEDTPVDLGQIPVQMEEAGQE